MKAFDGEVAAGLGAVDVHTEDRLRGADAFVLLGARTAVGTVRAGRSGFDRRVNHHGVQGMNACVTGEEMLVEAKRGKRSRGESGERREERIGGRRRSEEESGKERRREKE